ncbi:hypothetical protein BTR23_01395 [Alkalihalophilus pseudofirmus]|nr:hypothetical protein BTR23_01395 [Alkalihalophilus pseudofirmus]
MNNELTMQRSKFSVIFLILNVDIIKDQEFTLKDIRSLYFVEEYDIPKMVKNFAKEEILVLEAKKLGLDVTDELESFELLFPFG